MSRVINSVGQDVNPEDILEPYLENIRGHAVYNSLASARVDLEYLWGISLTSNESLRKIQAVSGTDEICQTASHGIGFA